MTSLDAHTIDFGDLKYGRSNVTGFRMIDPLNHDLKNAVNDWEQGEIRNGRPAHINVESVKVILINLYSVTIMINSIQLTDLFLRIIQ